MKFLPLPKSKQFKIVTRYYDPQKETIDENDGQLHPAWDVGERNAFFDGSRIKGKFRSSGSHFNSKAVEAHGNPTVRLIYILLILCALFYFFLN